MQQKMHTDSFFGELGLVEKLATSSRTSQRKTLTSNKNVEMQIMQRIELPKMMQSSYPTESPS
jgi:hypothetical protein